MKTKLAALLIAGVTATSASASDVLDRHLIELGFLSAPVEPTTIVRSVPAQPRDGVEAMAIEAGFLTLPAADTYLTVQRQRPAVEFDRLTTNLIENGFLTPPLNNVSELAGSAPEPVPGS
ncbi:hypothetical protein CAI21_21255 [Alkalilimnicola ehrlichii]|uniref:Uncharacterized protein n=1 Tax=Alkalilimnicola ehrlichii TaxID=351052 RepID=A0A3E0WJU3_9GAMM|nr:hypothetical protein [Alkalilimnicola ehrlichii]RFA24520.1 hypothetical protein CAI21_21255 [Alkalilimnicola ehrlichii]RFA32165.1 hypothetical protein CAL65_20305 [Alkalilimnicola ehrlichii]